jgi:hypothetical protein
MAEEVLPVRKVQVESGPPPLLDLDDIPTKPNGLFNPDATEWRGDQSVRVEREAAKRLRRRVRSNLAELEASPQGLDGESRFDWRNRAVSQRQSKAEGERWFPDMAVDRIPAEKGRLEMGQPFYEELQRYKDQ